MPLAAANLNPIDAFAQAGAVRALVAVVLLAVISAAIGWAINLRDLPFFTHAIGAGVYPVLVGGVLVGVSLAISALVGALIFALVLALIGGTGERSRGRRDSLIGLLVVAALAIGSILASSAGSNDARLALEPEELLFGSPLAATTTTLAVGALAALMILLAAVFYSERWLASGFDRAGAAGFAAGQGDRVLLLAVALSVGALVPITGALLVGALLIMPAASVRLFTQSAGRLPRWTLLVALVEGIAGLYLALAFELPTGATIAAVAAVVFFGSAITRRLADRQGTTHRAAPAVAASLVAAALLAGCGSPLAKDEQPIKVVATTPQIADIVRQVAGSAVELETLLPRGIDPHGFQPRPINVEALSDADVIFVSGGDIDQWLRPALKNSGNKKQPVDLSRAVVLLEDPSGAEPGSHWYLAPTNVARAAQRVRDELVKADPPARETFRANANHYLDEIEAMQRRVEGCASRVPTGQDRIITGHDGLDYLADAIDFKVVARVAASGELEASASEQQAVVKQARRKGARALVADLGGLSEVERSVAKELAIPLVGVYADNLTTGDDGSTLLDAINYDVDRIVSAVTGGVVTCPEAR